ncbi:uncharacterized protein LOC122226691 isoform X1 [Panthera leo]|uniref:uncharacterized protein LOC122226691 isoform X1 n=1 Tax=Panthera leo TaxID=9689 RepID=UPI001C6A04F6|nr:uncharacterized protein LOC122226691 isoform X1 [Panthera leo]
MLFGGVLWLDYLSLPWFPSCLDSRDPIGPQRPGQLPAGGKAQSPSPETEQVTSEQRRRALWFHLAFTQRVSPWPGQDFPPPQDARGGPGLSCREPTACYPGVVPGTRPGQSGAPGHKRRASSGSGGACRCPDHAGGDAEAAWRGRCSSALRRLRAAAPHRSPRPGAGGGLQRRRKSSQLPLPRPASVTVDLWGNAGPTWASVCSQMSRLRAQPSERRPATVTQRAAPGRAPRRDSVRSSGPLKGPRSPLKPPSSLPQAAPPLSTSRTPKQPSNLEDQEVGNAILEN